MSKFIFLLRILAPARSAYLSDICSRDFLVPFSIFASCFNCIISEKADSTSMIKWPETNCDTGFPLINFIGKFNSELINSELIVFAPSSI